MTEPMIACVEAEAAFLGCLLQTNLKMIAHGLLAQAEVEDFHDPRHRDVHTAMTQLADLGDPLDPVTVLGQMRRTGLERSMTDDKSAAVFLTDLMSSAPSVGSVTAYLTILLEHRARREVEIAGTRLQQAAGSCDLDTVRALVAESAERINRAFARVEVRKQADAA